MTTRAFEYMPLLRNLSAIRVWSGFRPATPDNLPYIGALPGNNNVFIAAGHEGLGITTSLGTGHLVTDLILGNGPAIPIEPYSPARSHAIAN
jgi:glycine/D-amino acid oxidase-like deaminating enzyme